MTYSFDVFDTCIVRTCARPADLFYLLAEELLRKSGQVYGREEVSELAALRVAAEKQAHKTVQATTQTEEITLADIYGCLELDGWGFTADEMREAEVRLELAAMRPVVPMRTRIEALQGAGERVLFVSDMYLPREVVREMLERCGYTVPDETLYVSNDVGKTKRAGSLYRHVLEKENLSARDLLHCGDGVESDFLGARKAGVRPELFTGTQLNRFERAMLNVPSRSPWVTSQLAGISRVTRLSVSNEGALSGSAALASSVVAPLLVGFVTWVLQDAKTQGLERLYFVARDGQVLHKIAQALEPDLEVRYLYGSRQAWYIPSAFTVSREELEFVLMTGQSSAPRHNLKRLNLTPEGLEASLVRRGFPKETWDVQLEGEAYGRFWAFLEDPEVAPQIVAQAEAAREAALAYFEQEGLLRDDRWALVDVGWTLRTQGSLHKILASAGQPHTLGYYLGISKTRFSSRAYGQGRAYLLEEAENEALAPVRTLFENKGLIDQVFTMADHGSTSRYACVDGKMEPVLSNLPAYPQREAFLRTVHELVTKFAEELAKSPAKNHEPELRACARLVTGMLIAEPTRAEAKALAWAPISDDPNELRAAPLAKPLSAGDLFGIGRDVFGRIRKLRGGKAEGAENKTVPTLFYKDLSWGFSWLEGSVAMSGPLAKLALKGFRTLQYVNREKKNARR